MAVTKVEAGDLSHIDWIGLSGDTKPSGALAGQTFYASDTELMYIWSGAAWVAAPGGGSNGTLETRGAVVAQAVEVVDASGAQVTTFGNAVSAANTGRSTATNVLPVQVVDAAGNVPLVTAANTGRSTATLVSPVQIVDAAGAVLPASPTVKGADFSVYADITIDATAYSIGDAWGAMATFAGVASAAGKHAIINTITLLPNGAMPAIPVNVWILNADLATPVAKNAAFTLVAADALKVLGVVPITALDYIATQDSWNFATLRGVGLEYTTPATSVYVYIVTTATTAPVATSVRLQLSGEFRD